MRMARENRKAIFWGFLSGIYLAVAFVNPYKGETSFEEMIFQLSGSRGELLMGCSLAELTGYILRMLPGYALCMAWGTDMYRHFCTASVYVFSRCTDRRKWYQKMLLTLFIKVGIYEIVLAGTVFLVTAWRYMIVEEKRGPEIFGMHLAVFLLWHMIWILLMNLLSLRFGSSMAGILVICSQTVCTAGLSAASFLERRQASAELINSLMKLNPVSHTILGWQYGGKYALNPRGSLLFLAVCCGLITLAGGFMVGRLDILTEDLEKGTI